MKEFFELRPINARLVKFLFALLFPILVVVLYKLSPAHLGDTDRYYHFALSKMLSDGGSIKLATFPQAEDIGWGNYFPEKEFLFHVFTRFAYSLGGENGVVALCLAFAAGIGILIYLFALEALPPALALLCAFSVFFSHALVFRLLLVRPHVVALFFFTLLNFAILRRRPWLTAFASAAFVLAYHAFYLPLICIGFGFLLSFREKLDERAKLKKVLSFGIAGMVLGILVNPYFPSQVAMGIFIAKIPFLIAKGTKGLNFGLELYPLSLRGMLKFYYLPFLILLAAIWAYRKNFNRSYLIVVSLFFGALSFQTVRAGEYFVPVVGLLLANVAAQFFEIERRRIFQTLWGLALFQSVVLLYMLRTEFNFYPDGAVYEHLRKAISVIPPGPAKVLNCEWDTAPYLLHARPDLRFVDLLDPSFLYVDRNELFRERRGLITGNRADPYRSVGTAFRAEYVLCRDLALAAQLVTDPGFQQLYPQEGSSSVYLFRRAAQVSPSFLPKLEVSDFAPLSLDQALSYAPSDESTFRAIDIPPGGVAIEQYDLPSTEIVCRAARAPANEIRRLTGARYLGLGGGQAIRAWRNGKLLYASGPAFTRARSVQALVPLQPLLSATDRLDFLVCSFGESPYLALAVSLWSDLEAKRVCDWKKTFTKNSVKERAQSQFSSDQESCLGTMASPAVPRELRL